MVNLINETKSNKPKFQRYIFYATPELMSQLDEIGRNKLFITNRSELIRTAIRELLAKWGKE